MHIPTFPKAEDAAGRRAILIKAAEAYADEIIASQASNSSRTEAELRQDNMHLAAQKDGMTLVMLNWLGERVEALEAALPKPRARRGAKGCPAKAGKKEAR